MLQTASAPRTAPVAQRTAPPAAAAASAAAAAPRAAQPQPTVAQDKLETKSQNTGMFAALTAAFDKSGIGAKVGQAIGTKNSEEVVAAVTGGLVELAVERTGVSDLDKRLHDDYAGTIKSYVKNETAQKALLAMGDVLTDRVASELVSATAGAVTGTTVALLKDPAKKKLYNDDKLAFGKCIAAEAGKEFLAAFAGAFASAKAEDLGGALLGKFMSWMQK